MSDTTFIFGLDNIILKGELIAELSEHFGLAEEIQHIRQNFPDSKTPFRTSYMMYIEKFNDIPLREIRRVVKLLGRNELLYKFITENRDRCCIITGHADLWINELLADTGAHYYTSEAAEKNGYLHKINRFIDKTSILREFTGSYAAVGNNNNDVEIIAKSKVGIGYGGTEEISPSVLNYATHAVFDEQGLYCFLNLLL